MIRKTIFLRLAYGDFTPFTNKFIFSLEKFIFVWKDTFLGGFEPGSLLYLIRFLFEFFLRNPFLIQTIFILTFLLIGYYGMYALLSRFKVNKFLNIVLPFFYLFNPITAGEMSNGAAGSLVIFSLIPFLFVLTFDFLEKSTFKKGFLLSIISGILLLNLQISFWVFLFLFLFIIITFYHKGFKRGIFKNLILYFGIGFLLNITSIYQFFIVQQNYMNISYLDTFIHNYKEATFLNLFRMIGNNGSSQPLLGYFNLGIFNILAFIYILIIFFSLILSKEEYNETKKVFFRFSLLTLILLILLISLIKSGLLNTLIESKNLILITLRNPHKLFYIFGFIYIILLGIGLDDFYKLFLKKNKIIFTILMIFILAIFIGQNGHFLSGDFGLSKTRGEGNFFISPEYNELSKFILKNDNSFYYLYIPFDRSLSLYSTWDKQIVNLKMGGSMIGNSGGNKLLSSIYGEICEGNLSKNSLKKIRIKYIILDNNPNSYVKHENSDCKLEFSYDTPYIWGNSNYFVDLFKNYSLIYRNSRYSLYKITEEAFPKIFINESSFQKVNPTKYNLYISNIKNSQNLSFLESYHKDWKLYLKKNPSNEWCNPIEFYNDTNTTECEHTQKFFEGEELSYLWKKPIFNETHTMVYDYANQWIIDPQYIKDNYPPGDYTENPDGSINVEMILYFKPQSYFYLGLIISGTTFLVCIGYLVYGWRKERKSKKLKINNALLLERNEEIKT